MISPSAATRQSHDHAKFGVIDCDSHVIEPCSLWSERLPDRYRDHAPVVVTDEDGFERLLYRGIAHRRGAHPKATGPRVKHLHPAAHDPNARLAVMDAEGVTASFILPTRALIAYPSITDTDISVAFCRAYNDWLAEFCASDPRRLLGVALLPAHCDSKAAVAEAERAVITLGLAGAVIRPNVINGIHPASPALGPLLHVLGELETPLFVHEGSSALVDAGSAERATSYGVRHILSHRVEQEATLVSMVMEGVFEEHPRSVVAFLEAGCGWLPSLVNRMNEHYETMPKQFPHLRMMPSEYVKRNVIVAADAGEPLLPAIVASEYGGLVVFGTDFPHFDADFPGAVKSFIDRSALEPETASLLLRENPLRLCRRSRLVDEQSPFR